MSSQPAIGAATSPRTVLVVGAGLLGTSLGLALTAAGWRVWLSDTDARAEALASDLGAGERGRPDHAPEIVMVAVPPALTVRVVVEANYLYPDATISDVASVKTHVQREIETFAHLESVFVGGHPLAGRERSGPAAARGDLFEGRPWVLTPGPQTDARRVRAVEELVRATGATVVRQTPPEHDAAVAVVSHLPQVAASLVAARLGDASDGALGLAGTGLRDTTRIAGSDPELWTQILCANAAPVLQVLDRLADDLEAVRRALREIVASGDEADTSVSRQTDTTTAEAGIRSLLQAGRAGHARIPGKHGGRPVAYAVVTVVIPDEPGGLARLFLAAGAAGVNIEDVSIEHSPGQPAGLVELAVAPERADDLAQALGQQGWLVH